MQATALDYDLKNGILRSRLVTWSSECQPVLGMDGNAEKQDFPIKNTI